MERKLSALSGRYLAALRNYLRQGPRASLQPARALGGRALSLGLETLDLVRIHEQAMVKLGPSGSRSATIKRAAKFFAEAVIPIERTHPAALQANAHLDEVNKALDQRAADLVVSNQSLKQSIGRRKGAEENLKRSGAHSKELLAESRRLMKHFRHLAHLVLAAQENHREKTSRDLQDEIAQTLLGINVHLLALKKQGATNADSFKKGIANTQRLVDNSVASIKRFARGFDQHHEP